MARELKVVSDYYDMVHYLSQRIEKFPRTHRYTLGAEIEHRMQHVLGQLIRAKYAATTESRRNVLGDVNVELEILRFQLRLAKDLAALPQNSHGHASGLLEQIGAQIGGWLRSLKPMAAPGTAS